ncbi:hypothetical protein C8035_v003629 [Colletotrichum spinosum]|uniref:Fungal N-terminal domain-containing protein n=1 Tax=Colletotrichum spinosum TaxID=1347390 RepID=A0A4R8QSI4_9PEZI|nr:hypothetical protein C8035_v003629 [Colletotrichum spinosum]
MDPLSIIASVAGIATAGSTVAGALFTLIRKLRHAPREMRQVAHEISDLSCLLDYLHDILKLSSNVINKRLLRASGFLAYITEMQQIGCTILFSLLNRYPGRGQMALGLAYALEPKIEEAGQQGDQEEVEEKLRAASLSASIEAIFNEEANDFDVVHHPPPPPPRAHSPGHSEAEDNFPSHQYPYDGSAAQETVPRPTGSRTRRRSRPSDERPYWYMPPPTTVDPRIKPPHVSQEAWNASIKRENEHRQKGLDGYAAFEPPSVLVAASSLEVDSMGQGDLLKSRLQVLSEDYKLLRVPSNEPVFDISSLVLAKGLTGKPIGATFLGDATSMQADHFYDYLTTAGQMPVCVRGSELGQTWFLGSNPVHVVFFHCSYQPQFFPAQADDESAARTQYLAIDQGLLDSEVMVRCGLESAGFLEGRLLLPPSTTLVSVQTVRRHVRMANTMQSQVASARKMSFQMRFLRQYTQYSKTFYLATDKFAERHSSTADVQPAKSPAVPELRTPSPVGPQTAADGGVSLEPPASVPSPLEDDNLSPTVRSSTRQRDSESSRSSHHSTRSSRADRVDIRQDSERRRRARRRSRSHDSSRKSQTSVAEADDRRRRKHTRDRGNGRGSDSGFASLFSFRSS